MLTAIDKQEIRNIFREESDPKFDAIDKRFEAVDKRLETVDDRFELLNAKIDTIDQKHDVLFEDMQHTMYKILETVTATHELQNQVQDHEGRITQLEVQSRRLGNLEAA